MSSPKIFRRLFTPESLKELYLSKVQQKASVGLDRINRLVFEKKLDENIETASRKVLAGTYKFSGYKEKLILKGRNALPRSISIPTLRDKVALKALNELLIEVFTPHLSIPSVHSVINEVKHSVQSGSYDYFLKFDIKNFYPSIDHTILEKKIRKRIRNKEINVLIRKAISRATKASHDEIVPPSLKGIPQGLSVSNILANIYLSGLDGKHKNNVGYKYFRYVDDILILCKEEDAEIISKELKSDIEALNLDLNDKKEKSGNINSKNSEFPYLGYSFSGVLVTVKKQNQQKLIDSLIDTLAQHKYSIGQSYKILEWRLNLRITGCVFDKKKYGWMFFFSQIDDLRLLHHLDYEIKELLKRFEIDTEKIRIKRFVRTFHEILKNRSKTSYIENFDKYDTAQKRAVLKDIFRFRNISSLSDTEIDNHFRHKIFKAIKDLEKDIQTFSPSD